jgi:Domain of unknown function (DUF4037)
MITNSDVETYLTTNPERTAPKLAHIHLLPSYAQQLVQFYAAQSFILAIMTIGSLSTHKKDKHSDIDLVLICDNQGVPPPTLRKDAIRLVSNDTAVIDSFDHKIWNFGTADDFAIDNQEICTQFFTKEYMEEKISLTIRGFYNQVGMEHPLASLSSLLKATVHVDKDGSSEQFRQKLEPYPSSLKKIILDQELGMRYPYYLNRLETAIARGDVPFADKMIRQSIDSAVYILFAQYERFPNGPKRLFEQLDTMVEQPKCTRLKKCFNALYSLPTTVGTLPQQQAHLRELLSLLKTPARG